MQLAEAFDQYLIACQVNGLSPSSTRWYLSILRPYILAYEKKSVEEVTTHEIRLYIASLMNRETRYEGAVQRPMIKGGLSPTSIEGHVRALHRFWAWTAEEYGISNPMSRIKRHKTKHDMPKGIDDDDLVKLFNATQDTPAGARDRALLCFLADTGCRIGAALNLDRNHLNFDKRRAVVTEKGSVLQRLYYTHFTAQILRMWLAEHPDKSPHAPVFCNIRDGKRLTHSGVYQALNRLKARAGVEGPVNPHAFRHGFARGYLKNGGDLATLSRLMGHKQTSTTVMFYAIFSDDELSHMHELANPLTPISEKLLIDWL